MPCPRRPSSGSGPTAQNMRRWQTSTVTSSRWPTPSRRAAATFSSPGTVRTSSATEEIELNRRLEEDYADLALEIVETDLGEWIAQLAGDTPSHIVGPILHMNKERITEILSGVSKEELPPDVEALGSFARRRLREKFLAADIGITGANFGVAETGTICTVTNEGNARLVTSIPPVHVVVMGIEKVIPKFEDLSTFVQLLARSGTGQKI